MNIPILDLQKPQALPSSYTNFAFCAGQVIPFVFSDAVTWNITKYFHEAEYKVISSMQPPLRSTFPNSKLVLNQYDGWPQYDTDQIQGKKQTCQIQEYSYSVKAENLLRWSELVSKTATISYIKL